MLPEFKVYQGAQNSLTQVGTAIQLAGKNGKIGFIPSNFNDVTKQIAVVIKRADGTSTQVTCSKRVTEMLRNKQVTIRDIANYEITAASNGGFYISAPGGLQEFNADSLVSAKPAANSFIPQELIAF
jgi:hypothetical protein